MASSHLLENYSSLVDAFLELLTVAIHLILYERDIYPARSFLKARKYNFPVRQNRHPAVCKFVDDAVNAVRVQLMKSVVASVSIILISPTQIPLERYVFSTSSFPIVGSKEQFIPFLLADKDKGKETVTAENQAQPATIHLPQAYTHIADLHAQYTAVLSRLSTLTSSLSPLPKDSSFTLAIELRETPRGEPPIGWPAPFVPAEPGLQRKSEDEDVVWTVARTDEDASDAAPTQETSSGLWSSSGDVESEKGKSKARGDTKTDQSKTSRASEKVERKRSQFLGGLKTVPIRSIEAGPFIMEIWIEQNQEPGGVDVGSGYKSASVEDDNEN